MRRLLPLISALVLTIGLAGTALAWQAPQLGTECAPDDETFAWRITLPGQEPNYKFDWSFDSGFATFATLDAGGTAPFYFETPADGSTLYVRWFSDHNAKTSAQANAELCQAPPEPGIDIVKTDDTGDGTVDAGTNVTYTYTVTNTGNQPLAVDAPLDLFSDSDAIACSPVNGPSGDDGDDGVMDPGEVWVFTCSVVLQQDHPNTACITGQPGSWDGDEFFENDQDPVETCDDDFVKVVEGSTEGGTQGGTGTPAATPAASLPNTALGASGAGGTLATVLFGLVLVASLGSLAYANVRAARH